MLEHWLQPVSTDKILGFDALDEEQLGRKITIYNSNKSPKSDADNANTEGGIFDLKNTQIAIIGIGAEDADAVRAVLYALTEPFLL